MHLISHAVTDFRNISSLCLEPSPLCNVICGSNGQGKTNLLESIFLLSGARSFRQYKDRDLIKRERTFSIIDSRFFCGGREQGIRLTISDKGRDAALNKGNVQKAARLAGVFRCVIFSPEHLMLVKGTPEQRRRFIDLALCQLLPQYLSELKKYGRLVVQKNNLLKDCARVPAAYDMLEVFDQQLAETSKNVTQARRIFCSGLLKLAAGGYAAISGGAEELGIKYISSLFGDSEPDSGDGFAALTAARGADIRAGFCTVGPHRDDLKITIDGSEARAFASQGQQRCAVLALKLAEADYMEQISGEKPLLLLDDVLSELDEKRQDYLIERLSDIQSIVTCCDGRAVSGRTGAKVFVISDGGLRA